MTEQKLIVATEQLPNPVSGAVGGTVLVDSQPKRPVKRMRGWLWRHRGSLTFIFLPTFIAIIYFFAIAADLYTSEARFIVRSPSRAQVGGVAGLLQLGGLSRAQDDVYAVQDFATSRDAMVEVGRKIDLKKVFQRRGFDVVAGYPNPIERNNAEDFYKYFQRRVQVTFDTTTGITTLIVKAFRAEDAQAIANQLLDASEALVNRLNERSRANAVRDAEAEVDVAEHHVFESEQNTLAYRNRESLLDPGKNSGAIFDTFSKMQADLASTRTRLAELRQNSPASPLVGDLEAHAKALDEQIAKQQSRLVGGGGALAPKISEYDQLSLRQEFAGKELASALGSLDAARAEARRQQIYLDRVVDANLSDIALYPKRLQSILIVFVSCFLLYSIGKLLVSGVREHAQD